MRHSHSIVNHGVFRGTGEGLADAAGADYVDYRFGEDGYQNRRVGRKS